MTQAQLAKLWSAIGGFALYYALTTWISVQGGSPIFGTKLLLTKGRVHEALVAILFCGVVATVASLIATLHARRGGANWAARVPIVGFTDIDAHSREGKLYQAVMLFLYSLVPLLSLIHFWRILLDAHVEVQSAPPWNTGIWDGSGLISLNDPAHICPATDGFAQAGCEGGVTFFPLAEPLALAALTAGAALAAARLWRQIFWPSPSAQVVPEK